MIIAKCFTGIRVKIIRKHTIGTGLTKSLGDSSSTRKKIYSFNWLHSVNMNSSFLGVNQFSMTF